MRNWSRAALAQIEPYHGVLAAPVALALAAGFTYSAWFLASNAAESEARIRFDSQSNLIREAIRVRLLDYEQVLRGGVGLFAASQAVTRDAWRAYVAQLRLPQTYPGIQGLGFVQRVGAADKVRHERAIRAEGFPQYSIQPHGGRPEYLPVVYIEPFIGRNLRAFGYDMGAEPARRAATELARDGGGATMSGRVRLVQETENEARSGVLMYVPVYRGGTEPATVAERRDALIGYVYSPFRMDDLVRGILVRHTDVRLRILDEGGGEEGTLLFESVPLARRGHASRYDASTALPMGGRIWTLKFSSLPAFEATTDREGPRLVAAVVGTTSAFVLAIIWSIATLRSRAVRLARSMTRALRDSRERLALAVEGSDQALFDWDLATGKVQLSERWSRIVGGGPDQLVTTIPGLLALEHPEDVDQVHQQTVDLLKGKFDVFHVEHRVRTADGAWRWISSRAKVVERDADGRATRVAGMNLDITERKEIERLKNEFVATVSHELRTPLTAMIGALGLLALRVKGKLEPDADAFLRMAQQNSERLALLVDDVLHVEKIESGRMELRTEAVAVGPLIERSIALNTPFGARYGVQIELGQVPPAAVVSGDEERLVQVITNLLSNAVKFSPRDSTVTVAAWPVGDRMRIAVSDRGPGIPDDFRHRIFQKFSQADGSDARRIGGSGLGLSICKALVEKMGGTLDYESTPGQGAVFFFDLPVPT